MYQSFEIFPPAELSQGLKTAYAFETIWFSDSLLWLCASGRSFYEYWDEPGSKKILLYKVAPIEKGGDPRFDNYCHESLPYTVPVIIRSTKCIVDTLTFLSKNNYEPWNWQLQFVKYFGCNDTRFYVNYSFESKSFATLFKLKHG